MWDVIVVLLVVFLAIGVLSALSSNSEWTVIRTYNIDLNSSRRIRRLFDEIEIALVDQFGAKNIDRISGGISVKVRGIVQAKLIGWKNWWGGENIMLGVSATIEDQSWESYEFPEKYLIGVANNEQPFYFMTLSRDQAAVNDSVNIIGMISEKLNAPYSSAIDWPKRRFIFCEEINSNSFLLITVQGNSYNLRSLDNMTWHKGFKQSNSANLKELIGKYSFTKIAEANPEDRFYSVPQNPDYWQERIRELNEQFLGIEPGL
jgi:hypothetical protein